MVWWCWCEEKTNCLFTFDVVAWLIGLDWIGILCCLMRRETYQRILTIYLYHSLRRNHIVRYVVLEVLSNRVLRHNAAGRIFRGSYS